MTALGATYKSACVSVRARVFFVFMRVFLFEGRMMSRNDGANKLLFFWFFVSRRKEREREPESPLHLLLLEDDDVPVLFVA